MVFSSHPGTFVFTSPGWVPGGDGANWNHGMDYDFPITLGISSSQLTHIFQRGRLKPPASWDLSDKMALKCELNAKYSLMMHRYLHIYLQRCLQCQIWVRLWNPGLLSSPYQLIWNLACFASEKVRWRARHWQMKNDMHHGSETNNKP